VPELPAVETTARSLAPSLVSRRITRVDVRERRLRTPIAGDFAAALTGRRITGVRRHGKFMLADLDDGRVWLVHLGMTGRLTIADAARADQPHDHVVLRLDDGRLLTYNDPRRFGRLAVIAADAVPAETVPGIDALSADLDAARLFAMSRRRKTSVKALLMDQRLVAGLGNIYVSEICHRAGIRPRRAAGRLRAVDCLALSVAIREILDEAIVRGGSSISDYRDGFDQSGSYQDHHRVYDRAGEPCRQCGTPIRSAVVAGRSTFWCPTCQR
jgi:formamidopyrimidine-DNA glycosylase